MKTPTPLTDAQDLITAEGSLGQTHIGVDIRFARELERKLYEARQECLEQARLNGMGGEREARLLSQVALLRATLERRHSEQSYHCGYVDEVLRSTVPRS